MTSGSPPLRKTVHEKAGMKQIFAGSRRSVVGLGSVNFFTDISSGMFYPVTPVFLTSILGTALATTIFCTGCSVLL